MKNLLLLVPDFATPDRLAEAVRVAAGLSQHPGLQVTLKLLAPPPSHQLPNELQEHFALFAEKGCQIYAEARWLPLLPSSTQKIYQDSAQKIKTSSYDLFIPF